MQYRGEAVCFEYGQVICGCAMRARRAVRTRVACHRMSCDVRDSALQ